MEMSEPKVSYLNIKEDNIFDLVDKEKIPLHLKESLTKIIENEGFLKFKLETNFIESTGGNYLGELHVAQIRGNTKKGYKEINLFMKSVLPFGSDVDFLSFEEVYLREIFAYTDLNKVFQELQAKANVPESETFKLAKFYETSNNNALIMENLSIKGFKVPEKLAIPSLTFCEVAMEQLARFHSLSFVMKKEKQDFFDAVIKSKRFLIKCNETWLAMINNSLKTSIQALKTDKAKERVKKYVSSVNWLEKFNYYYYNDDPNVGLLCHGDYRTQNILMRQKADGSTEIMPLDYQLAYYGHPVNDIIYFIFGATDQTFRKAHLDYLKSHYYDTMKSYLNYFDIDIEDVYSRKQYEQDFKERLDYAIIIGLCHLAFNFSPDDDFLDLSMDLATVKVPESSLYVRCLNELVDDLMSWGTL